MKERDGLVAVYNSRGIDFLTDNSKIPPTTYYRTRHTVPGDFPEGPIRDLLSGMDPEIVRGRYEGLNLKVVRQNPVEAGRVFDNLPRRTPDGLEDKDVFSPEDSASPDKL